MIDNNIKNDENISKNKEKDLNLTICQQKTMIKNIKHGIAQKTIVILFIVNNI